MMDDFEQPVRYYDENGEPHDGIVQNGIWIEETDGDVAFAGYEQEI